MTLLTQPYPNGSVIFCDDIRSEVGNKISFMGVYSASMALPAGTAFPVTLPKFGVAITWHEPLDDYPEEITFKAIFARLDADPRSEDGIVLAEVTYSLKQMFGAAPLPEYIDETNKEFSHRQLGAVLVLAPFVIPYPGKIRVRAVRKGEEWCIAAMRIEMEKVAA